MKSIKYQVLRIKHGALRVSFLILCTLYSVLSSAQGGTWTWISGSNQINSFGVFGTQGVPSVSNHPSAVYEPAEWKDKQGNFWIYGGMPTMPYSYSDLWKYNPVTNEWTWVKGDGGTGEVAVYGTKGIANPANTPGQRSYCATTWVDTSGNLWLFGGVNTYLEFLNDLWEYNISTNEWTWISGDNIADSQGKYGTQGIPSPANSPGARNETSSAWTDSLNNLWLFAGDGFDANGDIDCLNDLWRYDISTGEWTWMKGSDIVDFPANYGTIGVRDITNDPGARMTYNKWKDLQDNFWLMGGWNTFYNNFSDVWKYDLSVNEWTWMNGPNVINDRGSYQSNCAFNAENMPYSRSEQRSSVNDNCGRFWLFGGFNGNNNDNIDCLNDLWVFDSQQLQWNWLSGSGVAPQAGNYGTIGVPSPSNTPPSRCGAVAWWGNDNKFYVFGGIDTLNSYGDVWVFNPDTNCIHTCTAALLPVANFQSTTTLCAYGCINFTDLSTNATAWQWSFAGAADSTSTSENPQNVCYLTPGVYNVTLIASNSTGKDSITFTNYINVIATPPTPVITQPQGHDTLYCSTDPSYSSYQWYFNSTPIAGATDTFLVVSASGNYNVQVSNENGCKIAVGINVIIGIQNYVNDNVIYFSPNPASEKITIYDSRFTIGNIVIYNVLGQLCGQSEIVNRKSEIEMNVSSLPSGIYFVQVASESGRWVGRFVKE